MHQKYPFSKNWSQILKVAIKYCYKLFSLILTSFCFRKFVKIPENVQLYPVSYSFLIVERDDLKIKRV